MSAGVSRRQMVTVCLLKFSTTHFRTHAQRQAARGPTPRLHKLLPHTEIKKQPKWMRLPPLRSRIWQKQVLYAACMHKHTTTYTHTHARCDKSPPVSAMTSVPLPADEGRKCGWQIDWKIILSLIHHLSRFIILCLFNLTAGKGGKNHSGRLWPSSHPEDFSEKRNVGLWKRRQYGKRRREHKLLALQCRWHLWTWSLRQCMTWDNTAWCQH